MQAESQRLTTRRNGQANVEATRRAALELFVHNGFDGTSMREIARRVGVSAATIYNYTDSKESLLWDLVRKAREGLDATRERARSNSPCPAEVLRSAMVAMTRYHLDHAAECRVVMAAADSLAEPHASELAESLAGELAFFETCVAEVGQGLVEPEERRLTARVLVESTRLGAAVPDTGMGDVDLLPDRIARFGLRTLGVGAGHPGSCPSLGQCSVGALMAA